MAEAIAQALAFFDELPSGEVSGIDRTSLVVLATRLCLRSGDWAVVGHDLGTATMIVLSYCRAESPTF